MYPYVPTVVAPAARALLPPRDGFPANGQVCCAFLREITMESDTTRPVVRHTTLSPTAIETVFGVTKPAVSPAGQCTVTDFDEAAGARAPGATAAAVTSRAASAVPVRRRVMLGP